MSIDASQVAKKLSLQSVKGYYNPHELIHFPEQIDHNNWFMAPELISIFGSPQYEKLDEEQKKKLSFYETINFFSLNIHGEKSLLSGLTQRLYETSDIDITDYLHHFIDEENKHMYFFGTFCEKYAGKIYPDRKFNFPREYAKGEEEFLFFVKVFVFEEIVDFYNITTAKDERVIKLTREINENHHMDEVRHLAFGRVMLRDFYEKYASKWSQKVLSGVHEYIQSYYTATWKEYYNPDIYVDARIDNHYDLASDFFDSPQAKSHRNTASKASLQFLHKSGIIAEVFEL